jgi:Protein of unknown function (DUF2934)
MAKATPATEGKSPKKRTVKAKSAPENGVEVIETAPVTTAVAKEAKPSVSLEEKVRARAYELFLQRGGRGGSPEQDWLQAVSEIQNQSVA